MRFRRAEGGGVYTLVVQQEYYRVAKNKEVAGLKNLRTSTGQEVNYIDQSTFQIASTGEILKRIEPNPDYLETSPGGTE